MMSNHSVEVQLVSTIINESGKMPVVIPTMAIQGFDAFPSDMGSVIDSDLFN